MANIEQRRSSNGTLTYRVKVRLKGQRPVSATFERLTDAKRWAQRTEAAMRDGRYFRTAGSQRHTVADFIDRYLREGHVASLKSGKDRQRQLLWWKVQLGHLSLSDLTAAAITEARTALLAKTGRQGAPMSPSTVVCYLAALSHALSIAMRDWQWIEDTPMRKVSKPRQPRGRERFLSDGERHALLAACEQSTSLMLYPVVVLALSTGMRRGEIMGLEWRQIDFQAQQIRLTATKNGTSRSVALTGHALAQIQKLFKVRCLDSDLVFPGKNKTTPVDLKKPWTTACRRAGLTDFRFHDLRHSAASYLAMNGASTIEIAAVLGHKTLQMVKRYSHLTSNHTTQVVTAMNERIFGKAST